MSGAGDGTFAGVATRLAGAAGAMLGWSPAAFWRATPAELATVVRAAVGGDAAAVTPPDAALLARMRKACPDG